MSVGASGMPRPGGACAAPTINQPFRMPLYQRAGPGGLYGPLGRARVNSEAGDTSV